MDWSDGLGFYGKFIFYAFYVKSMKINFLLVFQKNSYRMSATSIKDLKELIIFTTLQVESKF